MRGRTRYRWIVAVGAVALVIASAAGGYVVAIQQLGVSEPEISQTSAEFCGERFEDLCRLEHANYRKAWKIGQRLADRQCLIATAESITTGNFAGTFGKVRWAGLVLAGGVAAYNTSVKNALLGVSETTDKNLVSEAGARDMVNGLRALFEPVDAWQERRGQERRICLHIALTGAATQWGEIAPKVHIGLALSDGPVDVRTFGLKRGLRPQNYARRYNIQLAIWHGLNLIEQRLETLPQRLDIG